MIPSWSLLFLGEIAALEGRDAEARNLLEQSLNALRVLELKGPQSEAQSFLGLLALRAGDMDQAEAYLAEGLYLGKETDEKQVIIWALIYTAKKEMALQHPKEARLLLEEGLALAINRSDKLTQPSCLEALGAVAMREEKPLWATRLFAVALALRESMGVPLPPIDRPEYESQIAAVHAQLHHTAFDVAWEQGRGMTVEQVLVEHEEIGGLRYDTHLQP